MKTATSQPPLKGGEFIEIPAWQAFGLVHTVTTPIYGSDEAVQVLLQEHPDQAVATFRSFRLEPGEYTILE